MVYLTKTTMQPLNMLNEIGQCGAFPAGLVFGVQRQWEEDHGFRSENDPRHHVEVHNGE